MKKSFIANLFACVVLLSAVSGCGWFKKGEYAVPQSAKDTRQESRGSLTGGDGLLSIGGSSDQNSGGGQIGVNSFLWRATLDTLSFMPLTTTDPFGGVVLTDWYEDPKVRGERFKVNALILDKTLRSDGIKITLFKQNADKKGVWRDTDVNPRVARDLEDTILTRARELRLTQSK